MPLSHSLDLPGHALLVFKRGQVLDDGIGVGYVKCVIAKNGQITTVGLNEPEPAPVLRHPGPGQIDNRYVNVVPFPEARRDDIPVRAGSPDINKINTSMFPEHRFYHR